MKLKEICAHTKTLSFWSEQEGKIIHWCYHCGSIQVERFSRGAFGSKDYRGLGKRIYPKNSYI